MKPGHLRGCVIPAKFHENTDSWSGGCGQGAGEVPLLRQETITAQAGSQWSQEGRNPMTGRFTTHD